MRKLLIVFALLIFSLAVGKCLYWGKDGFSYRRIYPFASTVSDVFDEESIRALKQPFHYIGRGRQCFAFASSDDKYVLKIPRTDHYILPFWVRALPVHSYRKQLGKTQLSRKEFLLESFRIAAEELSAQTGVLALHLGCSEPKGQTLTLIDALHYSHHLPLHKTSFILQYKKPILIKTFLSALPKDESQACHILDALLNTIAERAQKGIGNTDPHFLRNYGYQNGKAFQIDIGSFFRNDAVTSEIAFEKSFRDSTDPVQEWLMKTAPQLLPHFQEKRHEILLRLD